MGLTITQEEPAQATYHGPSCCVYLLADKKTIVKSGSATRVAEAEAMKLVRERTTIPVPEVYNVHQDKETGHVQIVMEFIEGDRLDQVWDNYTEEERKTITTQLRNYFDELRQIKGSFIGSVDGSACEDPHFEDYPGISGPYTDEAAFNRGLVKAWSMDHEEDSYTQILCQILEKTMKDHGVVMTHNDLDPRNIIVRGSEVVGIIDWKQSGFYPEYWEYCRALWRPSWDGGWMKDRAVDRILEPYLKELALMWNTSYTLF
ncbi:phosphotransferase enzyme family protein [Hypoxylon sp. NC1633]|nr:phosphotransferase enzyme family protein [Hypoxylon sp. NC1633]